MSSESKSPSAVSEPATSRDKILPVEDIAALVKAYREAGRKVIQAHGTFDLLHLGHVRHLEAARRMGDMLVVTVTADRYVNKGPGRPVFTEQLRAEMLAALGIVDLVGINPQPDAVTAIQAIKPDVYVKGQDYQNPEGDITGKITDERDAVEAHGGRIAFTDEVTYSSSELINRHLNVFEPHVRQHLNSLRNDGGLDRIRELLDKIQGMRVLLIGDTILDEYQYVLPMGKSAKENMIATRYQDTELFAGGVLAAANHVAGFCKDVSIITCLGGRDDFEPFIRRSLKPNIRLAAVKVPGAPTTRKRRFVDPSYMRKLFEVYFMDDAPVPHETEATLNRMIAEQAPDYDVVIITDFGHGMMVPSVIETATKHARFLAVNAQTNSANTGFNLITRYKRADYVCIDAPEARLATGDRVSPLVDLITGQLSHDVDTPRIIITHGKHGCVTFERDQPVHTIPAFAKTVIDTVGAGDAFLSVTAPFAAAGAAMDLTGFIGNVVGALKVGIVGHRESIDKVALVKAITTLLK